MKTCIKITKILCWTVISYEQANSSCCWWGRVTSLWWTETCFSAGSHGIPWSSLKEPNIKRSAAHRLHMLVPQRHAGSIFVGGKKKTFPLTCLSPLCRADAVLGAGDVLTSWWVLSVLLHSSFRFSSSLSLCFCNRRRAAEDGVPPRTFSMEGLRPRPSPSIPGKPVLAELSGSMLLFSPLLYSAQRFRMVSSRCLSFKTRHKKHCFLIFSLLLLCLKHIARPLYILWVWIQAAS